MAKKTPVISNLRSEIICGDSESVLKNFPNESVNLIFTSPPYYNARPEYAEYDSYETYLSKMQRVIHECHRVLSEGRFFIINVSPVLIRRASRSESSKRLALPFDFHSLFMKENFEFIDDIIWVKPEGAGWASGRGRRFSADRTPLQYKTVPITEYILVYRKKSERLIDWLIRKHPNKEDVIDSKILGNYDVTNVWKIHPSHNKKHPAVFPIELSDRIVRYYSFKNDVVLDPFCGTGTTLVSAKNFGRRYIGIDYTKEYVEISKEKLR